MQHDTFLTQWNIFTFVMQSIRIAMLSSRFDLDSSNNGRCKICQYKKDRSWQKTQMDYSKPIEHVLRWAIFHRSTDKRKADLCNRSWNAVRLAYTLANRWNRSSAKISRRWTSEWTECKTCEMTSKTSFCVVSSDENELFRGN